MKQPIALAKSLLGGANEKVLQELTYQVMNKNDPVNPNTTSEVNEYT